MLLSQFSCHDEDRILGADHFTNEQKRSLEAGRERVIEALKLGRAVLLKRALATSETVNGRPPLANAGGR